MGNFLSSKLPIMQTGIRWFWLTLFFLIVDQVTKYFAVAHIKPYEAIEVMPFFNLVIRYNTGAAFSFLADAGGWQMYFLSGIALCLSFALVIWLYKTPATNRLLCSGLALILAGAIGNLVDRLRLGKVVDFIDWYYPTSSDCFWGFYGQQVANQQVFCHWPSFNIADAVILMGAILFLLDSYLNADTKQVKDKTKSDNVND